MTTVTISVTVHTDNYGNTRIEVSDKTADAAIAAMDQALEKFGKRRKLIETETVTETATEQIAPDPIVEDVPAQTPAKTGTTERIIDPATLPRVCDKCGCELKESEAVASAVYANGAVRCVACRYPGLDTESMFAKPKSNSDPTPVSETAAIPEPEQEQPAKNPTPVNYVCEECQAEITTVQHDVSQLFNNRDLCKTCMKSVTPERGVPV